MRPAAVIALALLGSLLGQLPAGAGGAATSLVSHTPASAVTTGTGTSEAPVVSADGAFVAFVSNAPDLVAGQVDGNEGTDVFLYERATGAVTLVSHVAGSPATAGNGDSRAPSISANGAFVAFESSAANLVGGQSDANAAGDIFLFERATGAVTLVSHSASSPATAANRFSRAPVISADGGWVAFESRATDLVAGQTDTNNLIDVFLFSRATGSVALVSHTAASTTTAAAGLSMAPSIDAGGRFVAFVSGAPDLVPGQVDTNQTEDVFVFDRDTGGVALVSHHPGSDTTTAGGASGTPIISGNGGFVAFVSFAGDLVAGMTDANGESADVFLYERATATVTLVSHAATSPTTTANGYSFSPSISTSGGVVAFASSSTNLVPGQVDGNGALDVFLSARPGSVSLVSHAAAAQTTAADRFSTRPQLSGDGGSVAFESAATNLVPGQVDGNDAVDVFLHDRVTGFNRLLSHAAEPATTANGDSDSASISGDGGVVAFQSTATNLVLGQVDLNMATDVFVSVSGAPERGGAPADFDGDGDSDVAVYRPSSSSWFVRGGLTTPFGTTGDVPVPGDYDGDGDTDVAVFRPSTGVWFVQGGPTLAWGTSGDIPVPGDYDGDGDTDLAVFRPSTGVWFVQGGPTLAWGTSGDIPAPGDYDGDGDTDVAVFRPSTGVWFVQGGPTVAWGTSGDVPVPGDYDGDGDTDLAVFRPSTGVWFIQGGPTVAWGTSGDVPLPLPDAIRRSFY